jgi:hypothetical protein
VQKIKGAFQILCGVGLWIFGIAIGVSWIGFCFGTIVVGVLLLLLAPWLLLLPFTFGTTPGTAMIALGLANLLAEEATTEPPNQAHRRATASADTSFPTWVNNSDQLAEFTSSVQNLAQQKGVPQSFFVASFSHKQMFHTIFANAGMLERSGASFTQQQTGTASLLFNLWAKLDDGHKRSFSDLALQPKTKHDIA